jgi:hypothetical protein
VDDMTIVCLVDPGFGDILNFNVGQGVDLEVRLLVDPAVSRGVARLKGRNCNNNLKGRYTWPHT